MHMNKKELMRTLYQLGNGKFVAGKKKISEFTTGLQLAADTPVIFECDGETEKASNIRIGLIPQAIKILTN